MKFQNPSMHRLKVRLCIKQNAQNDKGPNSRSTFQNLFKSLSGHVLIATNLFLKFQGSSFNSFLDILLTRFHPCFSKGHNSGKGHNPDKKKNTLSAVFS